MVGRSYEDLQAPRSAKASEGRYTASFILGVTGS